MRPTYASFAITARSLVVAVALSPLACRDSTMADTGVKLAFTVQPSTAPAGQIQASVVKVSILDDAGDVVTSARNTVTLALDTKPADGTLSGPVSVAAVDGVASFPGIRIDRSAVGYTLSATSPGLAQAVSSPFTVLPGPAAKLGFVSEPQSTIANTSIPTFAVALQDALGNTVPTEGLSILLTVVTNSGNGAQLIGTTSVTTISGVATFVGISIDKPATGYSLRASVNGYVSIQPTTSAVFNMTVGNATHIVFTTQPNTNAPDNVITPVVTVGFADTGGNLVLTGFYDVTLSITPNATGANLSGTTTVTSASGAAKFSNIAIDKVGSDYTLNASAPGLISGTSAPFAIRQPLSFSSAAAGYFHSCALDNAGKAYCWGANQGQLGDGATVPQSAPVPVSGGHIFSNVSTGRTHTCGIDDTSHAFCWGTNSFGELGSGIPTAAKVPTALFGSTTFTSVKAGYSHTCAVSTSGAAYCWGDNSVGQLGTGVATSTNGPAPVSGGLAFATVSVGRYFSCGVTIDHIGYCWGENGPGTLGDGTNASRNSPVKVSGSIAFATVEAGGFFSCGLATSGAAFCWGENISGQLGNASLTSTMAPVAVAGSLTFTSLTVGNRHACGLTAAGEAYCWGDNSTGSLGNGGNANSASPSHVSGGLTFASLTAGRFHTCGITTGGAGYCWGQNGSGQLGAPGLNQSMLPAAVR